ncbi:MAG TPA: HEAT repeat domain-containing protein [Bryobacteraceae bacterium]|nr:HEAT repeat domain-containing protein [Bryobacteraceae bacterium]
MVRILGSLLCLSAALMAQAPVVGDINFYGLHGIAPDRIMSAAKLKAGGPLPASKGDMEDHIAEVPGVGGARVEAICCEGAQVDVFIGIEAKNGPHSAFRSEPTGNVMLSDDLLEVYQQYGAALRRAAARGKGTQDLTAGHAITSDQDANAIEQHFLLYAAAHLDELRNVLRNCADPDQRAAAAAVMGYAVRKSDVVDDLEYALQDPDDAVRTNALKALNAIAVLGSVQPDARVKISPTWMVELLHSVVLSDRIEAVKTLLTLTDHDGQEAREQIRDRALADLIDMARWKTPRYALPPFLLLGRVAGATDKQTEQSWAKGDRESIIARAQTGPKKRLAP